MCNSVIGVLLVLNVTFWIRQYMIYDTSEMSAGIEIAEDRANDCDGDFTIRGRLMSLVEKVAYLKRKIDKLPKKKKDKKPSKRNSIKSPSLVPLVLVHWAYS